MLIDWFVALVLVFVLHYLMALVINMSSKLTGLVEGSSVENIMLHLIIKMNFSIRGILRFLVLIF